MSYNFNDIMEFQEFVSDSFKRGDYTQEVENFKRGINTISIEYPNNPKHGWDWLEGEKLYLVKNENGELFIIYQHPFEGFERFLWFFRVRFAPNPNAPLTVGPILEPLIYDTWNMGTSTRGECWVREYVVLDSHSLTFMNWVNENPFEVKR